MKQNGFYKALIPHKDTLLILAREQKKIIKEVKLLLSKQDKDILIIPEYPLWCITNEQINEDDISSLVITGIGINQNLISFELQVKFNSPNNNDKDKMTFQIDFAEFQEKYYNQIKKAIDSFINKSIALDIKINIFRTATVEFINNSWAVTNEHWIKIQ